VQLYADVLSLEGEDLRNLPLHLRKTNRVREAVLVRRLERITFNALESRFCCVGV
jgi:hypothetical protein